MTPSAYSTRVLFLAQYRGSMICRAFSAHGGGVTHGMTRPDHERALDPDVEFGLTRCPYFDD
jgi:hypothetical protein